MVPDGNGNGSGSGDWAQVFASFHDRHRDGKGRKLKFTLVFNVTMEAFIGNPEVPIEWRVLAFIWRHSWGNASDTVVDKIGANACPLRQNDIASRLGVPHRRISESVILLREMNYLASDTGYLIQPIEDPTLNSGEQKANQFPAPSGLFFDFCSLWKVQALADSQELESAEATVNRIKKVRLGQYKKWLRARTKSGASLIQPLNPPNIIKSEETSSSSALPVVAPPPAQEPPEQNAKAEEEEGGSSIYQTLKSLYPADHFDEPKAKPSFEGLSPAQQRKCIERLQLYLECERWKSDKGRWIPLCSNWLKSYAADPPPALQKPQNGQKLAPLDDVLAVMRGSEIVRQISGDPERDRKLAMTVLENPQDAPPDVVDWARRVIDA